MAVCAREPDGDPVADGGKRGRVGGLVAKPPGEAAGQLAGLAGERVSAPVLGDHPGGHEPVPGVCLEGLGEPGAPAERVERQCACRQSGISFTRGDEN